MAAPKGDNVVVESPTARLVMEMCNSTEKSQLQIAKESGFPKSNIITMLKSGRTKFPIRRIRDFAKAVDGDAEKLLDTYLEEYMPEVREVIASVKGRVLSGAERSLITALRDAKRVEDQAGRTHWTDDPKAIAKWAESSVKKLCNK